MRGTIPAEVSPRLAGQPYRANDTQLLFWVHATVVDYVWKMYEYFVEPLSAAELERYHQESNLLAILMGVPPDEVPATWADFRAYMDRMLTGDTLDATGSPPALPAPLGERCSICPPGGDLGGVSDTRQHGGVLPGLAGGAGGAGGTIVAMSAGPMIPPRPPGVPPSYARPPPTPAGEALLRLRDGNRRFARNAPSLGTMLSQAARGALISAQSPPIAVVLSCSDARVPAELVFDQGLGDLFVVRVAGNVIAPTLIGSVEYAVGAFGTALVVVMGHTHCGAIAATLDWTTERGAPPSEAVREICARVEPAIVEASRPGLDRAAILAAATRANVRASVRELCERSQLVGTRIARGELLVVGAEYALETGYVEFLEEVPT